MLLFLQFFHVLFGDIVKNQISSSSQGVIVMRMTDGAHVVNFAAVKDEEQAAKEAEQNAELIADEPELPEITVSDAEDEEIELLELETDGAGDEDDI